MKRGFRGIKRVDQYLFPLLKRIQSEEMNSACQNCSKLNKLPRRVHLQHFKSNSLPRVRDRSLSRQKRLKIKMLVLKIIVTKNSSGIYGTKLIVCHFGIINHIRRVLMMSNKITNPSQHEIDMPENRTALSIIFFFFFWLVLLY